MANCVEKANDMVLIIQWDKMMMAVYKHEVKERRHFGFRISSFLKVN